MRVILKDDVDSLGHIGDVKDVAAGYARNYLIPNGLVIPATDRNVAQIEHERRLLEAKIAERIGEAKSKAAELEGVSVTISVKVGEDGKLFGSVTNKDIAEALAAKGIALDRKTIRLDGHIKSVGDLTVKVDLGRGITTQIGVSVVSDAPETEAPKAAASEAGPSDVDAPEAVVSDVAEASEEKED
ncbi:MAG: 50S ribosomal protein L9 [Leptospirillia bacterium]